MVIFSIIITTVSVNKTVLRLKKLYPINSLQNFVYLDAGQLVLTPDGVGHRRLNLVHHQLRIRLLLVTPWLTLACCKMFLALRFDDVWRFFSAIRRRCDSVIVRPEQRRRGQAAHQRPLKTSQGLHCNHVLLRC